MTLPDIIADLYRLSGELAAIRTAGGPESAAAGEAAHHVAIARGSLARAVPSNVEPESPPIDGEE